ncbi:N-formylglutamate amidohydrolase [Candidatus Woesearchaeota archaeon]|nr:N-formylglutamate amidohydrolase [Candidatus Woesearchaeota archaeon]
MEVIRPDVIMSAEKPLIVVAPHSSTYVSPELEERLAIDDEEQKRFTDMYLDELFAETPNVGGVLVPAPISRFVVQLNKKTEVRDGRLYVWDNGLKSLDESDPKNPDSSFVRYSWTGNKVMDPELTEKEMIDIYEKVYKPFFETIEKVVREAHAKFGYSVMLVAHSFNPVSSRGKKRNTHFVLGTRDWRTANTDLIKILAHRLNAESRKSRDLKIGIDTYGFDGDYITGHYSKVGDAEELRAKDIEPRKCNAVQIEVNKGLYISKGTDQKHSLFKRAKLNISHLLETAARYMPNYL